MINSASVKLKHDTDEAEVIMHVIEYLEYDGKVKASEIAALIKNIDANDKESLKEICAKISDDGYNAFMISLWQGDYNKAILFANNGSNPFNTDLKNNRTVFHSIILQNYQSQNRWDALIKVIDSGCLESWISEGSKVMNEKCYYNLIMMHEKRMRDDKLLNLFFGCVNVELLAKITDEIINRSEKGDLNISKDDALVYSENWSRYMNNRAVNANLTNNNKKRVI